MIKSGYSMNKSTKMNEAQAEGVEREYKVKDSDEKERLEALANMYGESIPEARKDLADPKVTTEAIDRAVCYYRCEGLPMSSKNGKSPKMEHYKKLLKKYGVPEK